MSADPSLEPLSTTMVSKSTFLWRASEPRHARNSSFRFQFTTTTEINCLCYQAPAGTRMVGTRHRQKQGCQRATGKERRNSKAVLSVPGTACIPCYIMSLEVANLPPYD